MRAGFIFFVYIYRFVKGFVESSYLSITEIDFAFFANDIEKE